MVISYDISRAGLAIMVFLDTPNCLQCFYNFYEVRIYFSKQSYFSFLLQTEQ